MAYPNNFTRALFAERALDAFQGVTGMEDEDINTIFSDLLADLLHYCRQHDMDFETLLDRAVNHFQDEVLYDD
jgi:hypothetical protein